MRDSQSDVLQIDSADYIRFEKHTNDLQESLLHCGGAALTTVSEVSVSRDAVDNVLGCVTGIILSIKYLLSSSATVI